MRSADETLVERALAGERGPGQQRIASTAMEVTRTLLHKNRDYGEAAWQPPVLVPDMPAEDALLVRMSDKVQRLRTLMGHGNTAEVDESIRDTMADLAGYALLWLAMPDRDDQT